MWLGKCGWVGVARVGGFQVLDVGVQSDSIVSRFCSRFMQLQPSLARSKAAQLQGTPIVRPFYKINSHDDDHLLQDDRLVGTIFNNFVETAEFC